MLSLGCGIFFSRYSLSSVDKTRRQRHIRMSDPSVANSSSKKRPAVEYSFQPSICYCHKLLIFTGFYTNKYILTQMNKMITYALMFVMGKKNWLE